MIKAQIIADSKNTWGYRITTFVLTFPRIILAELNTHRMFSRNSASSRAIPFKKMLERVQNDPFIPIAWQKDHSGMQGTEYFTAPEVIENERREWLIDRDNAIEQAVRRSNRGVTKQIVNRTLEPFMWHTAIVTATDFENFFHLRCPQYVWNSEVHKNMVFRSRKGLLKALSETGFTTPVILAKNQSEVEWHKINKGQGEIHIMALAETMWDAYNENIPAALQPGQWHIPFGDKIDDAKLISIDGNYDHNELREKAKLKIATARCARVSYNNFDGTDDYGKDIELHDRLAASGHWSPFEHCARAMSEKELDDNILIQNKLTTLGVSGNFKGFMQYRKLFPNENKEIYIPIT